MVHRRGHSSAIGALLAALAVLAPVAVYAQTAPAPARPVLPAAHAETIVLEAGGGRVFRTGRPIANLFAADPKVAEARPASTNSVFVFGVGPGRTTVAAMDDAGNVLAQYQIIVHPSSFPSSEAARNTRGALPNSNVRYTTTPDGMISDGFPATPQDAERANLEAQSQLPDKALFADRGTISAPVQVTLRVRIAEISRAITRQLGINWTAMANIGKWGITAAVGDGLSQSANLPNTIGGSFREPNTNINTILDLLAQDELITLLAEPNLTARSGETASFLAGGEYPIPVSANNNTISIAFKQYGVSLSFVPTVLTDGRISLHVRPEVSQLTSQGAITVPIATGIFGTSTITIPALLVRRADTTVELGSGQSFAIAGLLQGTSDQTGRGLPYLGELPVIGPLFRSDLFLHNKSELVIVVTPYIVRPVSVQAALRAPTDGFVPAGDFDRHIMFRQYQHGTGPEARPVAPTPAAVPLGQAVQGIDAPVPAGAGFMIR
jgi:pilus assembly protein CpaC